MAMPPPRAFTRSMLRGEIMDPAKPRQRHFPVHALEDVESPHDGLVVRGVETEGPAALDQVRNHRREVRLHVRGHVRAGLAEVLEVRRGIDQHLPGSVEPKKVVATAWLHHPGPAPEVLELSL